METEDLSVRKQLLCVPMMTLLLLTACGSGGGNQTEELALTIRGEYLEAAGITAMVDITADYGQRVYQYTMEVAWTPEETAMTLTAPDTVAGITARVTGKDSRLEFDGLVLETGPLNEDGLTPVSAVPVLLEAVRSGYITACTLEEETGLLRLDCGDPEGTPGSGTETVLWLDTTTHTLVRSELLVDGFRAILCEWTDFTKE